MYIHTYIYIFTILYIYMYVFTYTNIYIYTHIHNAYGTIFVISVVEHAAEPIVMRMCQDTHCGSFHTPLRRILCQQAAGLGQCTLLDRAVSD